MALRPQVIASIPYRDVWGGTASRAELEELLGTVDWRDVVTTAGGIAAISWQHGIEDAEHRRLIESFVADLPIYGHTLIITLRADDSRVLFTEESLLSVLRLAIVASGVTALDSRTFRDKFLRAVLMANELIHAEIEPLERTGTPQDLLASELRSRTTTLENPHVLLARTAAFFEWARSLKATISTNHLPAEDDLKAFTGLTPPEYAAGAYSLLSRSAVIREPANINRNGIFFTFDRWLAGVKDRRVPEQWVRSSSLPIATARSDWKAEPSLSFAAAGKLWTHPVVQDGNEFFVPSPKLVANAMGDGTYFTLLDGYSGGDKDKFTRFYSEFFEDYIANVFEDGYSARQDATTTRAITYERIGKPVESSDLIITEGNDVIFVEVVAKRLNLVNSCYDLALLR
jgi:hypothetical protein